VPLRSVTERPDETGRGPANGALETPEAKARTRALRLLARMEKSRHGLSLVLARAGFSRSVIGTVLDDLERRGLVDDRRFARLWLSSQVRARPRSLRLLRRDLLREGVAPGIIEEGLREVAREHPEAALAEAAARKKLRPTGADPARLARLLAARGFTAAVVQEALRTVLRDDAPCEEDAWRRDDSEHDAEP
jgi:regulatory protein